MTPPKFVKRRGSQLEIRVRKTHPQILGPCPAKFKAPHALRISLMFQTRKLYVDSSTSISVGAEQESNGHKTLCVDNRVFFKRRHQRDGYIMISEALTSLKVMPYLHDRIAARIMSMGETKYKNGKKVKRNDFKGIVVKLTWIKTFVGDRDSVVKLFDEADQYDNFFPL